jgi:hypothetical protein
MLRQRLEATTTKDQYDMALGLARIAGTLYTVGIDSRVCMGRKLEGGS